MVEALPCHIGSLDKYVHVFIGTEPISCSLFHVDQFLIRALVHFELYTRIIIHRYHIKEVGRFCLPGRVFVIIVIRNGEGELETFCLCKVERFIGELLTVSRLQEA